jgi:hypothetical protein
MLSNRRDIFAFFSGLVRTDHHLKLEKSTEAVSFVY